MGRIKKLLKDKDVHKTAFIFLLLIIMILLFAANLRAQNITGGDNDNSYGNKTVEEILKNPSDVDDENLTNAFWEFTAPEYIVVNKEGNRDIMYCGTESYAELCTPAMDIMKGMYGNITRADTQTGTGIWENMLSVNSALLHFPANVDPAFHMQFLGLDESPVASEIDTFSDVLIVTGLPEQKEALIYIKEAKTEKIVRFETEISVSSLNDAISKLENVNDKNYAFGYELKLDKALGNSTRISSMLTIPLVNIDTPKIEARVPKSFSQKLREVGQNELSRDVMSIFGCDPSTVRSYTDTENSRILLASDRRIILSSDGIIEFYANKAENGIDITGDIVQTPSNSLYVAISGTFKTILGMFEITGTDIASADYQIKLTEMSGSEDYQSEIRLNFDYYINGYVMEYTDVPGSHAIEVLISNGRLVYFKMELKNFVKTGDVVSNSQMITAIDEYCSKHKNEDSIYIYDSHLYYGYKKNNEHMQTDWAVN